MIEDGDVVTIDVKKRTLDVNLSDNQFEERRAKWTAPPYKSLRGVLFKVCFVFIKLIVPKKQDP